MKNTVRLAIALGIVAAAISVFRHLESTRPEPSKQERKAFVPTVRVLECGPETTRFDLTGHGVVRPERHVVITAQVSGTIVEISPSFKQGARVRAGETLVRIDEREFDLAVDQARSKVAELKAQIQRLERDRVHQVRLLTVARQTLALQEREVTRQQDLRQRNATTPATLDKALMSEQSARQALINFESRIALIDPQTAQVAAQLAAAEAQLELSMIHREKTRIRSDFPGRVLSEAVELGQFVMANTRLGEIYDTRAFEVVAKVPQDDLAWIADSVRKEGSRPVCEVKLEMGNREVTYRGIFDRIEGHVDEASRMVSIVLRVEDPWSPDHEIPLMVGSFVQVRVPGREVSNVVRIPRTAIRDGDQVHIADSEGRLRKITVQIVRTDNESVLILAQGGLARSVRLITTKLAVATEGMQVSIHGETRSRDDERTALGRTGSPGGGTGSPGTSPEARL